jgi:hypothetical protein
MDLDVAASPGRSLKEILHGVVIPLLGQDQIVHVKTSDKGPAVLAATFRVPSGAAFDVELVNAESFKKGDGKVDFDVNNLKLGPCGLEEKFPGQGGSVQQMVANCLAHTLRILKPPEQLTARIAKMKRRGWKVLYG